MDCDPGRRGDLCTDAKAAGTRRIPSPAKARGFNRGAKNPLAREGEGIRQVFGRSDRERGERSDRGIGGNVGADLVIGAPDQLPRGEQRREYDIGNLIGNLRNRNR